MILQFLLKIRVFVAIILRLVCQLLPALSPPLTLLPNFSRLSFIFPDALKQESALPVLLFLHREIYMFKRPPPLIAPSAPVAEAYLFRREGSNLFQDGLRRRMDKLKGSIEEGNRAVDKEREKNVSLLHLIFPPDIARRLWLGEPMEAKTHEDVTMLFSDIVGFTQICSTATPMMVINMLQNLYNQFDTYCGQIDVYKLVVFNTDAGDINTSNTLIITLVCQTVGRKHQWPAHARRAPLYCSISQSQWRPVEFHMLVETIGDAYCVAGGLHKETRTHAQQIAWMSLKMIETCSRHQTHEGQPIKSVCVYSCAGVRAWMRIGLHTGSVLAGIVGVKMPRYCMFGHNVGIANKFESGSEPLKINVSPTTYTRLKTAGGFITEERDPIHLPKDFPTDIVSWLMFSL
ncbi:hypothetical protein NQ318_021720 [Aromia moschata]|uniref:Guanylate cyclase domain-containing protein n=1 Tax=Aromia moschata TaxID=1265417 RepID=A0AAV8XY58_9CUCU|nr:hypothetical protein NQ318_021720 [Aromia moschata]